MTGPEIDWAASERVAAVLGMHTRELVASRNAEPAIRWALQQSNANTGTRAISYFELAVLLGHSRAGVEEDARREWQVLMERTQRLAAAVKAKADAEAEASVKAKAGAVDDPVEEAS